MRYQLVRTSPYLGGQIRWDIPLHSHYEDGEHILEAEELHIVPLNDDIPFRDDNSWDCLKYTHSKNISRLYSQIGDSIFSCDGEYSTKHWLHQGDDLLDPYSHKYIMGARRIRYQRYGKQFSYLCPLWISEQTDPSKFYFVVSVRVVGEERDHIARTIIRFNSKISKYMEEYLSKSPSYISPDPAQTARIKSKYLGVTDNLLNIKFDPDYAYISGIEVKTGLPRVKDVSYIIPDMLNHEQPLMEFDNMLLSLFSSQKMIAQQLINLNFVFNLDDISYYFRNELLGRPITIDIRVGYGNEYNPYRESTLLPLKDFYTDYQHIPVFRSDLREYSASSYVCDYMGDNKMINYVHANKFTQPIFHWTMAENPKYIYNFYDGFSPVYKDAQVGGDLLRVSGRYFDQADLSAIEHTSYNSGAYWCKYLDLSNLRPDYFEERLRVDTNSWKDLSIFSELIINEDSMIAYLNNNRFDLKKMDTKLFNKFKRIKDKPTIYLGNLKIPMMDNTGQPILWGPSAENSANYYAHLAQDPVDYVYVQYAPPYAGDRYNRISNAERSELPRYEPDDNGDWVQLANPYLDEGWTDAEHQGQVQGTWDAMNYHLGLVKVPTQMVQSASYLMQYNTQMSPVIYEEGYAVQGQTSELNKHDIEYLQGRARGWTENISAVQGTYITEQQELEIKINDYIQEWRDLIQQESEYINNIHEYCGVQDDPENETTGLFKRQYVQGGDDAAWVPADYDSTWQSTMLDDHIEWRDVYFKIVDGEYFIGEQAYSEQEIPVEQEDPETYTVTVPYIDWDNVPTLQKDMFRLLRMGALHDLQDGIDPIEPLSDEQMSDLRNPEVFTAVNNFVNQNRDEEAEYVGIIANVDQYDRIEDESHKWAQLIAWMMQEDFTEPIPAVHYTLAYPAGEWYWDENHSSNLNRTMALQNVETASQMVIDTSLILTEVSASYDDFNNETADIRLYMDAWKRDASDILGDPTWTNPNVDMIDVFVKDKRRDADNQGEPIIIFMYARGDISNSTYYQFANFIKAKGASEGVRYTSMDQQLSVNDWNVVMEFVAKLYDCWIEPYRIAFDTGVVTSPVDDMIDEEKPSEVNAWYVPQTNQILRYTGKLHPLFIDEDSEDFQNYTFRYKQWQDINDPKVQKYNRQIGSGLNPVYPSIGYYCFEEEKDSPNVPAWYSENGWYWEIPWKNTGTIIELPDVYQDHTEPLDPQNYDEDIEEKYMWDLLYKYIGSILLGHSAGVSETEDGPELTVWLKHKLKELYTIRYNFDYASDTIQEGDTNLKIIYYVEFRLR